MSIRFTESDKWKDPWFSELSIECKILFLYMIDNCDIAGFYEINHRLINFQTGLNQQQVEGAIKGLSRGLVGAFDKSNWVWIKNFIKHQKNLPLDFDKNPAHRGIARCFLNHIPIRFTYLQIGIIPEGALKGLHSPTGKGKGKGKGRGAGETNLPDPAKKGRDCTIEELQSLLKIPQINRTVEQRNQILDASHNGVEEKFNLIARWKA